MKKILVVGGTGFIGYHVIKLARKKNWKIYSISLNKPKKKRFHRGVSYILADLTNYKSLKKKYKTKFRLCSKCGWVWKKNGF